VKAEDGALPQTGTMFTCGRWIAENAGGWEVAKAKR
jgi:hypothetical protein